MRYQNQNQNIHYKWFWNRTWVRLERTAVNPRPAEPSLNPVGCVELVSSQFQKLAVGGARRSPTHSTNEKTEPSGGAGSAQSGSCAGPLQLLSCRNVWTHRSKLDLSVFIKC
ncbi:hypothetical protein XENORESO_009517 [Xenotaenia resolanae]|uniref:Uncharacterized protein n=1 Tax=Xenotaenia resolanae TaxID=208358 RepID=A0ABV0VWB1_9TELE